VKKAVDVLSRRRAKMLGRRSDVSTTFGPRGRIEPTSEAWEASNKNLKTLELAALSDFRALLKWKIDGK